MKILVVGGGGREHAIAVALARNTKTEIFSVMANRNPGNDAIAKKVLLCRETETSRIVAFAKETGADYAFIGPKAPSRRGLSIRLRERASPLSGRHGLRPGSRRTRGSARDLMAQEAIPGRPSTGRSIRQTRRPGSSRVMTATSW